MAPGPVACFTDVSLERCCHVSLSSKVLVYLAIGDLGMLVARLQLSVGRAPADNSSTPLLQRLHALLFRESRGG